MKVLRCPDCGADESKLELVEHCMYWSTPRLTEDGGIIVGDQRKDDAENTYWGIICTVCEAERTGRFGHGPEDAVYSPFSEYTWIVEED